MKVIGGSRGSEENGESELTVEERRRA